MDMIDGKWIHARLSGARGERARLAEAMGIDNDKMSKILKGLRRVQPEEIPAVLSFFGEYPVKKKSHSKTVVVDDSETPDVKIGAIIDTSSARLEPATKELSYLPFSREYLERLTSSSPVDLRIFSIVGDAMRPTLQENDVVAIDLCKTDISLDGLFALKLGGALQVKRIGRSGLPNFVRILSDNSTLYPPIEVEKQSVEVIGKVLWYCRTF